MGPRDLGDDRQAQPRPARAPRAVRVQAGEAIEHRFPLVGGDALAVVVDDDHGARGSGTGPVDGEAQRHALACVSAGVVDEVAHDALEGVGVAHQSRGLDRDRHLESSRVTGAGEAAQARGFRQDDVVEVHVVAPQWHSTLVALGEQEQVLDHRAHPLHLRQEQFVDGLDVHRGAGGGGQLEHGGQRGQWASQLVGGVADEGHLGGAGRVEAGEHLVHGAGQARDLVLGLGHGHPLAAAGDGDLGDAGADRLDGPQYPAHGVVDEAGGREPGDGHERQEEHRAGGQDGVVPVAVGAHVHGQRHPAHVHADGRDPQVGAVGGVDLAAEDLAGSRDGRRGRSRARG